MGLLAALVSALLLILAFPPFGVGVLALVAPHSRFCERCGGPILAVDGRRLAVFGVACLLPRADLVDRGAGMVALVPLVLTQAAFPTVYGALLAPSEVACGGGWRRPWVDGR